MKRYTKRLKKHHLKRFSSSVINGHQGTVPGWAVPYNHRAQSGLKETGIMRMFNLDLGQGGRARAEIVQRLQRFTEEVQIENHIFLINTLLTKLALFYNESKNMYYFVYSEFGGRRIRRSKVYGSRARALWLYSADSKELTKITWVEYD